MPHKNLGKAPQHAANPENKSLYESGSSELLDELDALLINSEDAGIDPDALMACLDKLDEASPLEETFDVEASLQEFRQQHRDRFPAKAAKRRRLSKKARWLLVAVVVALLSGSFLANATDFNFIEIIAHWTGNAFHFEAKTSDITSAVNIVDATTGQDYPSLQDALNDCGISQRVAPTWLPEGCVLDNVEALKTERKVKIYTRYHTENGEILVSIEKFEDIPDIETLIHEKDRDKVREYDSHGITYYILSNNLATNCVWVNGTLACSIQGDLSESELEQMLDSI